MDAEPPQQQTLAAYLALVLIWSTTPLVVVLSLQEVQAVWVLSIRLGLALLCAIMVMHWQGLRLSWGREAVVAYAWGALSVFVAMLCTYLGAQGLPSGLIAVLFGMAPLIVALLSLWLLPGAGLSVEQWLGMLLGLAGLAVVFGIDHGGALDKASVALVFLGVFFYALSAVALKRRRFSLAPLQQTTGSLCLSVLACALLLPFFWDAMPQAWPGARSIAAILYSALMGSIVAMLCYFYLVRHISISSLSLTTVMTPVLALAMGVSLNGERFSASMVSGMVIILLGMLVYFWRELWQGLRAVVR